MNKTYIMLKDTPVLEIDNYNCSILDYNHLPFSLRYHEVTFDDVMHGWTEARTMNIGKTNAKKILNGFKIKQTNPYTIAKLFHFASLSDCYWMKEDNEDIAWKDVSLFQNPFEKAVTASALLGVSASFPLSQKIHTPELTTQGMSAKAWIREGGSLFLYKIGKKELAASKILDLLQIPHVSYEKASEDRLIEFADQKHIDNIKNSDENIVKCKIISSEETAILPWEEFQMYCSYHDKNEFDYIRRCDSKAYYSMQIADYILSNEDRHGANFGFFMDNETGRLLSLYPLMDHDHAFSNDEIIMSQTTETAATLREAALEAARYVTVDLSKLKEANKPSELTDDQWVSVLRHTTDLYFEYLKNNLLEVNGTFTRTADGFIEGFLTNGTRCSINADYKVSLDDKLDSNGFCDDIVLAKVLFDDTSSREYKRICTICKNPDHRTNDLSTDEPYL